MTVSTVIPAKAGIQSGYYLSTLDVGRWTGFTLLITVLSYQMAVYESCQFSGYRIKSGMTASIVIPADPGSGSTVGPGIQRNSGSTLHITHYSYQLARSFHSLKPQRSQRKTRTGLRAKTTYWQRQGHLTAEGAEDAEETGKRKLLVISCQIVRSGGTCVRR